MEFILKKDSSGKSTTNLKEIQEMLNIASLKKEISYLKAMAEEGKRAPKMEKNILLNILDGELLTKGDPFNITGAASLEKDKAIRMGTIYYNPSTDKIRFRGKNGWVTINFE